MLKKLIVPTHKTKDLVSKYFNENTILKLPNKKKHNPYFPNILCKFHAKNSCTKGYDCIFSHDLSQFQCPNGKNCVKFNCEFKHDDIDAVQCTQDNEKITYVSPFETE